MREIISRNYYRKLSHGKCGNYRDTGVSKNNLLISYVNMICNREPIYHSQRNSKYKKGPQASMKNTIKGETINSIFSNPAENIDSY